MQWDAVLFYIIQCYSILRNIHNYSMLKLTITWWILHSCCRLLTLRLIWNEVSIGKCVEIHILPTGIAKYAGSRALKCTGNFSFHTGVENRVEKHMFRAGIMKCGGSLAQEFSTHQLRVFFKKKQVNANCNDIKVAIYW